jgi:plastocyanin
MATCRLLLCAVACKQGKHRHPGGVLNVSPYHEEGPLRRVVLLRRLLTIFTLFATVATLAAGCAGDDTGGAASGGQPAETTAAPATTEAGGGDTGGGRGDYGGGGGGGGSPGAAGAVRIADFAFAPGSLSAEAGQSVTWTNQDGTAHTVTADDGAFDSGNLAGGEEFSFAFDEAGTYAYHCNIHPRMKGTVTVAA